MTIERWRSSPCFVLRRAEDLSQPYDEEYEAHYSDELDATRAIREIVQDHGGVQEAPRLVVQRLSLLPCFKVTCDRCLDDYEDPDHGGNTHWPDVDVIFDLLDGINDEWKANRDAVLCPRCVAVADAESDRFDIPQDALIGLDDVGRLGGDTA